MKHLRSIASCVVIAIAGMMFVSNASSQVQLRVKTDHRTRQHIVHHPRSRAHVRVNVPMRRHVERPRNERTIPNRHQ
jgi:hypothetical protein